MTESVTPIDIKTDSPSEKIIKPIRGETPKFVPPISFVAGTIVLGIISGTLLFLQIGRGGVSLGGRTTTSISGSGGVTVGSKDTKVFRDCTSGELAKNDGKITTEGSHMLIRPGGVSQTVYLTSSVVDLEQFVGKQVEVCGETFKGQKAGWLMDAGRITLK